MAAGASFGRFKRAVVVWPLPAMWSWLLGWLTCLALIGLGLPATAAVGAACALGVVCSLWGATWWRRLLIAAGFPVSLFFALPAQGALALPAWGWLVPLVPLGLVYPLNAWRDAPLFPTPADALAALPEHAPLLEGAWILDAGCGLGHGLQAMQRAYPHAALYGIEWSWPLRMVCALRCPWAEVRQGDIWRAPWSRYDMVYLFQRPESMARAAAKAGHELRPGSWLVSLEFEAVTLKPNARYATPGGKMVWLYQAPLQFRSEGTL